MYQSFDSSNVSSNLSLSILIQEPRIWGKARPWKRFSISWMYSMFGFPLRSGDDDVHQFRRCSYFLEIDFNGSIQCFVPSFSKQAARSLVSTDRVCVCAAFQWKLFYDQRKAMVGTYNFVRYDLLVGSTGWSLLSYFCRKITNSSAIPDARFLALTTNHFNACGHLECLTYMRWGYVFIFVQLRHSLLTALAPWGGV